MESESGEGEGVSMDETMGTVPVELSPQPTEESEPEQPSPEAAQAAPRSEGRRTQLRRVSDSLQILSTEVGRFRKSHEVSTKTLKAEVSSLRKEFATHVRSRDLGAHAKAHEADTKRLEKQIALLRSDLASLKTLMAKEGARSRAREEAALSKVIAKVKAPRAAKPIRAKPKEKR